MSGELSAEPQDNWDAIKGEWKGGSLTPLLSEVLPQFAKRLDRALRDDGELALADQLATLRIFGPCGCGDSFCSSFHTAPRSGEIVQSCPVANDELGMVCLKTRDGNIVFIEVV